jgi:hypothetical protein
MMSYTRWQIVINMAIWYVVYSDNQQNSEINQTRATRMGLW